MVAVEVTNLLVALSVIFDLGLAVSSFSLGALFIFWWIKRKGIIRTKNGIYKFMENES